MRGQFEYYETEKGEIRNIQIDAYPDGMPLIKERLEYVDAVMLRPQSLAEFFAAMFWVDTYSEQSGGAPTLILPSVPGARQDRRNATGDCLFTLRSVADAINARGFPCVTVLDPHSDVAPALIERCEVITAADCISPPAGKYAAVVSPDAGAEKRSGAVAKKLGVPLIHGWKTRSIADGSISGFGLEPHSLPADSLVLVVDDICDGGGTFIGLGDLLLERGLRAHLWTTHGLYTRGTDELLKRYGHLYCTDSAIADRVGVIEVNVCERLLKGEWQ